MCGEFPRPHYTVRRTQTTEETTPPVATEEPTPATTAPVTEETTTPRLDFNFVPHQESLGAAKRPVPTVDRGSIACILVCAAGVLASNTRPMIPHIHTHTAETPSPCKPMTWSTIQRRRDLHDSINRCGYVLEKKEWRIFLHNTCGGLMPRGICGVKRQPTYRQNKLQQLTASRMRLR